jgi:hypothetical protein
MIKNIFMLAVLTFFISSCTLDVRTDDLYNKNIEQEPQPEEDDDPVVEPAGCKDYIEGFVTSFTAMRADCDQASGNLDAIILEDCDEPATLITRLEQFRAAECSLTCSQWFTFADTEFFVANYAKAKELLSAMEASGVCVIGCTEMMLFVEVFLKTGDLMLAQMKVMQMNAASCDNTAEALALCQAAGACL